MNLKIMIFAFFSLFGTSCFQASDHERQTIQDHLEVAMQIQREADFLKKFEWWFEKQEQEVPGLMAVARRILTTSILAT
jgi:hypothetical protein